MADLLSLLREKIDPASIKRVSGRNGGEYHSPCPLCGGTDRFLVFPDQAGGDVCSKHGITGTWACPRGCRKGGDVITFLMEVNGLSFKAACAELKIDVPSNYRVYRPLRVPQRQAAGPAFNPRCYAAPPDTWKYPATKLAASAHERLLQTAAVLSWLAMRGLPEAAVRRYRLGYLAEEGNNADCLYRARSAFGLPEKPGRDGRPMRALWIPRGITIPLWGTDGQCLRIRIRRRDADLSGDVKKSKYLLIPQPGDPYSAPMSLPPSVLPDLATWVVVEAELDAMAVHHACGGEAGALSVLTVSGKPDADAHSLLFRAARILVALDFDQDKGDGSNPAAAAWPWWASAYPQVRLWPVPDGKDPGEAFQRGVDLRAWIAAGMALRRCSAGKADGRLENAAIADVNRPKESFDPDGPGLWHPLGPRDALRVLRDAGLQVVPVTRDEAGKDFEVHGHEEWSARDSMRLFWWLRRHGDWVRQALYSHLEVCDVCD